MEPSPFTDLSRPPLRAGALRAALVGPGGPLARLDVVAEVASTNEALARQAVADPAGWPSRSVLTADSQVAGRGRLGRTWVAPPRSGLALSFLLRPQVAPSRWSWVPLLAGMVVARVVTEVAGLPGRVKWPNDVLIGGIGSGVGEGVGEGKVAGILAEAGPGTLVLGIGLNVSSTREELPVPTATSLLLAGSATTDRDTLLRALVRSLCAELDVWEAADGDAVASGLAARVREACSTLGSDVVVDLPDGSQRRGVAEGIDDEGRLLVRTSGSVSAGGPGDVLAVAAGDVTHVRPADR